MSTTSQGPDWAYAGAFVHDATEAYAPGSIAVGDGRARRAFIALVRKEAHGVIWPSVTVAHVRGTDGTRIRVRGLAFRFGKQGVS